MATISSVATTTATKTAATATNTSDVLFHVHHGLGRAFSWSSIGLAVLTAFLQGLVTAIAMMTEQSNRWTFRFRLAMFEHWWWTIVSALLLCSLVMNALSFASGTGGEPISVLALSATTFIAIVQYMIPAWQERHYTRSRWLAWTGDSRTAISKSQAGFCGNAESWKKLIAQNKIQLNNIQPTPSDVYGWHILPAPGISWDPTDVLNVAGPNDNPKCLEDGDYHAGLYENGDKDGAKVSLRWGREQCFRRRVSRAVSSMPLGLLQSSPSTTDGYDGKGLNLAMGILGRNKGLHPSQLVFEMSSDVSSYMENFSTWTPRPAKVLRSFYHRTLEGQYGRLGTAYVFAAVELALLLADIPYWALDKWLSESLEHQDLGVNHFLAHTVLKHVTPEEREAALAAHYESSYVSMIISLNNMNPRMKERRERGNIITRPDLLCTGLLLKARGYGEPSWWNRSDVCERRNIQISYLTTEAHWKTPMARLLGLDEWPTGFENHLSSWNGTPPPKIQSATLEQIHATDTDHRLFDQRAAKRLRGTSARNPMIRAPERGREDTTSASSTRVASNDYHQEPDAILGERHAQPSLRSNHETVDVKTEADSVRTNEHPATTESIGQIIPVSRVAVALAGGEVQESNVLRVRETNSTENQASHARVFDESGYELDIWH